MNDDRNAMRKQRHKARQAVQRVVIERGNVDSDRAIPAHEDTMFHAAEARAREVGVRPVEEHIPGPARPYSPEVSGEVSESGLDEGPSEYGAIDLVERPGHVNPEIDGPRTGRTRNDRVRATGRDENARDARGLELPAQIRARDVARKERDVFEKVKASEAFAGIDSKSDVGKAIIKTVADASRALKAERKGLQDAEAALVKKARTWQPTPAYITHAVMSRDTHIEVTRGSEKFCNRIAKQRTNCYVVKL